MLSSPQMPSIVEMTIERADPMYQHSAYRTEPRDMLLSRILLVDDLASSRYELRHALNAESRLRVIGEATNGASAIAMACQLHPDIVVVGARLVDMSGIAVVRHLAHVLPSARVILLSITSSDQLVMDAMQAGAFGFLPRNIAPDAFARAVVGVADGEVALSRRDAARLLARLRRSDAPDRIVPTKLTKREIEVVRLLSQGSTDRQIAQHLTIEESTAKKHVQHILRKLRVRNRNEAAAKYFGELIEQPIAQS